MTILLTGRDYDVRTDEMSLTLFIIILSIATNTLVSQCDFLL